MGSWIIQSLYNLSDDAVEYQIHDRMSFMRFLGLHVGDPVPDAKPIWLFREQLRQAVLRNCSSSLKIFLQTTAMQPTGTDHRCQYCSGAKAAQQP
jgi:IS5 family transposase